MPSVRIDETLFEAAGDEAEATMRSVPKQIEYWARLGEALSKQLTATQMRGLLDGSLEVEVRAASVSDSLIGAVEAARANGALAKHLSRGAYRYEVDPGEPAHIRRIDNTTGEVTAIGKARPQNSERAD